MLFVGAGINGKAGLMWKELVEQVVKRSLACSMNPPPSAKRLDDAYAAIQSEHDLYAQATIAAQLLGPRRFGPMLRGIVYRRLQTDHRLSDLNKACAAAAAVRCQRLPPAVRSSEAFGYLAAIARLCTRPEIQAVVSYNYDTLLEHAISQVVNEPSWPSERRRPPVSIARQIAIHADTQPGRRSRLNVYHVHGCLPPPGVLLHLAADPVVVTQQDYARSMQEPYTWEDSTQLHCLRNFACLFLGLSMSDWNMLRLLHSALSPSPASPGARRRLRHFCIGASETSDQAAIACRLLAAHGVRFHAVRGRAPAVYAQVRAFTDELYLELEARS